MGMIRTIKTNLTKIGLQLNAFELVTVVSM